MKNEMEHSRFRQKQKQRRTILFNVVIGIVLLAAAAVAFQVFTGKDQQQATTARTEKKAVTEHTETKAESKDDKKDPDTAEKEPAEKQEEAAETAANVEAPAQSADALQAYTNPSWKPVGTTQTGEHVTQFDSSSQDWKEMLQAIALAVNVPAENMTVWRLGNNGANKAVGTVQLKDGTKQKYKVYIEWVDQAGWKPTLVERLN